MQQILLQNLAECLLVVRSIAGLDHRKVHTDWTCRWLKTNFTKDVWYEVGSSSGLE